MRFIAAAIVCLFPLLAASPAELEHARKLYRYTDYAGSLQILSAIQPKDGPVYELTGQNLFMQGEYEDTEPGKGPGGRTGQFDYALWLGRAYGRRAETSSPFTAPSNASKARQNFEKSVRLNPRNMEALSDLFEYYLEAPGFMGGGLDKATATAGQMAAIDPVEGHWAQARLAEKKKEFHTAEEHLQRAAAMAPQQVGKLVDLARFLAKQGRYQESEQSFRNAEKIAPNSPKIIYARADTYIQQGRNLDTARQLLKRYLQAELTPDDPSRADAEKLLKKASGG